MPIIHHTILTTAPMSHGDPGADAGNVTPYRRIPRLINGQLLPVPALSAGALRGVIRRLLWREVFDLAGLSRETIGGRAWDRLYAALANGGHIEKAEKKISPDAVRARRAALPVLSLLGAALFSSHMDGRAKVSMSWLQCRELGVDAPPMRDLLADYSTVRHVDREEQDPESSGVTPMPTTVETVVTGATFAGRATVFGDLEASAWAHGLDLVQHLGGKSGQGCGAVQIAHDGDGDLYRKWLHDHIDDQRETLIALANELSGGKVVLSAGVRPEAASEGEQAGLF